MSETLEDEIEAFFHPYDLRLHPNVHAALLQLTAEEVRERISSIDDPDVLCDEARAEVLHAIMDVGDIPSRSPDPEVIGECCGVRRGSRNPEPYLPDFWAEQLKTGRSGFSGYQSLTGRKDPAEQPVWSFDRFGTSYTRLPDSRWVAIAGEHEDHYDPDFCIYDDVTIFDGKGGIE
ncbi:MAG: hypothetical protein AAFX00_01520, partial [Pseudomonadota bacterium]